MNTFFGLQKQLQEQQKQLSLLQEEQLKSSSILMSQEKPQGQEAEVQTESQNDMEDAKPLIAKTHSLDTPPVESLDDKEKSGFSIRRSRTLPGRLKASHLELEDRTGICNSLSYSSGVIHVGMIGSFRRRGGLY